MGTPGILAAVMNLRVLLRSPAWISNFVLRVSVGLSMILVGISQYRDFAPFVANITDGLGFLWILGYLWSFILPALLIFGGGLLIWGRLLSIGAWVASVAVGSVPIGLLLKTIMSGLALPDMLDAIYPMFIWMILLYLALNPFPVMEEEAQTEQM